MKKYILLIWLLPFTLKAQHSFSPTQQKHLNVGGVDAIILNGGDMWSNLSNAKYEVPKGGGVNSLSAGGMWIGGYDTLGNLKIAAVTYRQNGLDFYPGPLDSTGYIDTVSSAKWNRMWMVYADSVSAFKKLWSSKGGKITVSMVDSSILFWPGKNNPHLSRPLLNQPLAPFTDVNHDGKYDPLDGDYPNIKGDQAIWWVYNDNTILHTETGGKALGIEAQVLAYAYRSAGNCTDYSTFYDYTVYYKGKGRLDSVYIGEWADPDLGYPSDDYAGCDTARYMGICYNGEAHDSFYKNQPPIVGIGFNHLPTLSSKAKTKPIFHLTNYSNDFSALGNPITAQHYYNYLSGTWKDGSYFTQGGYGHGGTKKVNAIWPGDPKDTTAWSECTAKDKYGDRRFVMSVGPYTLHPGDYANYTVSAVWVRPPVGTYPCPSFKEIDSVFDCNKSFVSGIQEPQNGLLTIQQVKLYPNPAQSIINIEYPKQLTYTAIIISDIMGKVVYSSTINVSPGKTSLHIDHWAPGMYFYKLTTYAGEPANGNFIIAR